METATLSRPEHAAIVGPYSPHEHLGQLAALLFGLRGLRTCLAHLVLTTAAVDEKIEVTKDLYIVQQALGEVRRRIDELCVPPAISLSADAAVFPLLVGRAIEGIGDGVQPRALAVALAGFVRGFRDSCVSIAEEPTLMVLERVESLLRTLSPALRGEAEEAAAAPVAHASESKHPDALWAELEWPALPTRPARDPSMLRAMNEPKNPTGPDYLGNVHGTIFSIEIPAAEVCAMILARFEPLPEGLEDFLARQCWDEGRHAKAFLQFFRETGGKIEDYPFDFDLWDDASRGSSPEEILCTEQVIGEGFNLGAEQGAIEKHRVGGRESMVRLLEYVYLDEVQHVRHGLNWFRRLAAERAQDILLDLESKTKVRPCRNFTVEVRRYVGFTEAEIERHAKASVDAA